MSETATADHLGPIDFVAVQFLEGQLDGTGFRLLLDRVKAGGIYIIDLEFLTKQLDGSVQPTNPTSLGVPELAEFSGADSGLLDRDDVALLSADLAVGGVLAVLIYEDRTMIPVLTAWERVGGAVLAEGVIGVDDLEEALGHDNNSEPEKGS